MSARGLALRPERPAIRGLAHRLVAAGLLGAALAAAGAATAAESTDWKEAGVSAPGFSTDKLLRFEVSAYSELSYGIDPATLSLGPDGVVRYVMVARSASGALNVAFEGVRCATAEVKTYARWTPSADGASGQWRASEPPAWRPLIGLSASRPALALARSALCQGVVPAASVADMVRELKRNRLN